MASESSPLWDGGRRRNKSVLGASRAAAVFACLALTGALTYAAQRRQLNVAGVAEAQAEPSEALTTATPPAASSSSSSNRAADDDAVGTVVVTDPDDDGKASVDDGTLLSPETDDGDDDGGGDDDDACAAITDEGECHASSACQWKSDDSTCFASQLDDDDRAAQPDQPTVATADDGASGDDGAGDDGASGLVSGLSLSVSNEYERTLGYSIGDGLYPFENLVEMYKPTRLTVSDTAGDPQQNENYTWIVRGTDDARHAPTKLTARGDVVEARFVQLGSNLVLVTVRPTSGTRFRSGDTLCGGSLGRPSIQYERETSPVSYPPSVPSFLAYSYGGQRRRAAWQERRRGIHRPRRLPDQHPPRMQGQVLHSTHYATASVGESTDGQYGRFSGPSR